MMKALLDQLIYYHCSEPDDLLVNIADLCADWERQADAPGRLLARLNAQVLRLLSLATDYGFNEDLWQCLLAYTLMRAENPFSLTCERAQMPEGSASLLARRDLAIFRQLFRYNFGPMETSLGTDCLSILRHYHAVPKQDRMVHREISEKVIALRRALNEAQDDDAFYDAVTEYYRRYGAGAFGFSRAFRVRETDDGCALLPIRNLDGAALDLLIGYDLQKAALRRNVEAFLSGRPYNNMLLYGDAGTGKSTSVKALCNAYADRGLRLVEIYKHQLRSLGDVIGQIKARGQRFLLFIDDLSFEENEVEYKYLKAAIEGGVESRPDNVLICATSNRRHLIRETWNDRNDMEFQNDVHRSDTLEERLSLAARFGLAINFPSPSRAQYHAIVRGIAQRYAEIPIDDDALIARANTWEIRHGGLSGRTAEQFIFDLAGQTPAEQEPC